MKDKVVCYTAPHGDDRAKSSGVIVTSTGLRFCVVAFGDGCTSKNAGGADIAVDIVLQVVTENIETVANLKDLVPLVYQRLLEIIPANPTKQESDFWATTLGFIVACERDGSTVWICHNFGDGVTGRIILDGTVEIQGQEWPYGSPYLCHIVDVAAFMAAIAAEDREHKRTSPSMVILKRARLRPGRRVNTLPDAELEPEEAFWGTTVVFRSDTTLEAIGGSDGVYKATALGELTNATFTSGFATVQTQSPGDNGILSALGRRRKSRPAPQPAPMLPTIDDLQAVEAVKIAVEAPMDGTRSENLPVGIHAAKDDFTVVSIAA